MYASLWHIPLTRGFLGSVIPASKTLQYENRFPFSVMNETHSKTSYISMQTLKTHKHKQLYTGGKFQSFHLTLSCTWHRISSTILHQWTFSLWWRETSYTEVYAQQAQAHPHRANPSHTPTLHPELCKCQTVGERVYLGVGWYFYTFHYCFTLTHTLGFSNTAHPVQLTVHNA